jgi:hypothetical protein
MDINIEVIRLKKEIALLNSELLMFKSFGVFTIGNVQSMRRFPDNYFGMSVGEKAQSDLEFINSDKSDGLANKHLFHYAEIIDINSSLVKTDAFIEKSTQVHGNKYDYSLVNYVIDKTNVKIICREHGVFEQRPSNHTNGQGCRSCWNDNRQPRDNQSDKIKKYGEKFLADSARIHGDKYDYSLFEYINSNDKVKIICREHGVFEQRMRNHTYGQGCRKCNKKTKETTQPIFNFEEVVEDNTDNEGFSVEFNEF